MPGRLALGFIFLSAAACAPQGNPREEGERQAWVGIISPGYCAYNVEWKSENGQKTIEAFDADFVVVEMAIIDFISNDLLLIEESPDASCQTDRVAASLKTLGEINVTAARIVEAPSEICEIEIATGGEDAGLETRVRRSVERGQSGLVGYQALDDRVILQSYRNCSLSSAVKQDAYGAWLRSADASQR